MWDGSFICSDVFKEVLEFQVKEFVIWTNIVDYRTDLRPCQILYCRGDNKAFLVDGGGQFVCGFLQEEAKETDLKILSYCNFTFYVKIIYSW